MLENGSVYIFGRDKFLNPNVIINMKNLIGENGIDLQNVVFFIVEFLEKYVFMPGKIENLNLIIDCQDIGFFNFPYVIFNNLLALFSNYYI